MVLTLYKLDASPPARAVYMVIHALNIKDVEYVDVNLIDSEQYREEYLKLNPQHTIPTLKDEDFVIWDSHAIASYLVTKYGKDDSLYPKDPKKRAIVDQRLHFDSGILFPALRGTAEPIIFWGEKTVKPEQVNKIKNAYSFMENFLSSHWLAGDEITLADICCVATLSSLNAIVDIEVTSYPKLVAWWHRCAEQEWYKKGNVTGLTTFKELFKSKLA